MSQGDATERYAHAATRVATGTQPLVAALSTTPVKGLRMCAQSAIVLELGGVSDNRRFYLVDEDGLMVNGKRVGALSAVVAGYEPAAARLTMTFPDGSSVSDVVQHGEVIETQLLSRSATSSAVLGPWSEAISAYVDMPLRLVEAGLVDGAVDRGAKGAVSLISEASVARLQSLAGGACIDRRRFRMLIELARTDAHEEDTWVGRTIRIGEAQVAVHGHVGRCLVTNQCPDSGIIDLPTLELLSYRRGENTTEPLAFGVFGEVLEPGLVCVGDAVTLD